MNRRNAELTALLVLVVVATVLRFATLDRYCFMTDEVHSMHMATGVERELPDGATFQSPWAVVPWIARKDIHPPVYFVLLNGWLKLFGTSEVAGRSLSALLMVACVPLVWRVGRKLVDPTTALVAAGFCALSPFQIRYGQDLRMYPLALFFILLSTLVFLRMIRSQPVRRRDQVLYALCVALTLMTHYFMIFIFLAHAVYVLTVRPWHAKRVLSFVTAQGMALALFLPWGIYAYTHHRFRDAVTMTGWLENHEEMPYLIKVWLVLINHLLDFIVYAEEAFNGDWIAQVFIYGPLLLCLIGLVGLARSKGSKQFVLMWFLVPLGGMMLVDLATGRNAFFVSRYFIGITPAYYLLLACGVTMFRTAWWRGSVVVVALAVIGVGIYRYEMVLTTNHPYDAIARSVETNYTRRPLTVIAAAMAQPVRFYLRDKDVVYYSAGERGVEVRLASEKQVVAIRPPRRVGQTEDDYRRFDRLMDPLFKKVPERSSVYESVRIDYYERR